MPPALKHAAPGETRVADKVAAEFGLTGEERDQLLASGRQSILVNRVSWAKIYLGRAGLLDSSRRGCIGRRRDRLTDAALKVYAARLDARLDELMARTDWGAWLYADIRSVIETARRRAIGARDAIRLTLAGMQLQATP